jgi:predicted dehydrogenase
LQSTALAATGTLLAAGGVHAESSDVIKVGLIGCGGRGSGAAHNVLVSAPNVVLWAIGDAFEDQARNCRQRMINTGKGDDVTKLGNKVDLPQERVFVGLDAYKKVIDSGVNYVILATPPGFRPIHLEAAVAAGKNIFTEKPVGVDGTGIRKVLAAYDEAKKKNLGIAAGTQRRHQQAYIETLKRLHAGEIGDLVAGRCYWNQGLLWSRPRKPGMSDVEYQMWNWYNFVWTCGDHIVEQHVHNIDVINWALQTTPIECMGMGGRSRNNPDFGSIFDFFAIDFTYPKDVHVLSMCRQISGCANKNGEELVGTKGMCVANSYTINGKKILTGNQDRRSNDPYVVEHTDLIQSIRSGNPINELKNVAESTLTAIMGRMSAYTGKKVTWDFALNSKLDTMPKDLSRDMKLEEPPVPVPGKTPLI